ncbi:hypothetical protein ET996_03965 [Propioniciclava tarda]|uniref:Uncharacterized protein n=1 Tax=Propioniciclava tarda TaxID=433330 RepID=A0A4V2JTE9_PROTD|nr:hypothetical protein ET996_03965 [Propioniciclava tarda]
MWLPRSRRSSSRRNPCRCRRPAWSTGPRWSGSSTRPCRPCVRSRTPRPRRPVPRRSPQPRRKPTRSWRTRAPRPSGS